MRAHEQIFDRSAMSHGRLCPRQILGVRMGLVGMKAVGFTTPAVKKQLFVICETDGCFVDGISAATGCKVGHRTLRIEDYGKVAATFIHTKLDRSVRVVPRPDIRERAHAFAPGETRRYFAQMIAYRLMPDDELLTVQEVSLTVSIQKIISRPGVRVKCDVCGEEIINQREIRSGGLTLCQACAGGSYYQTAMPVAFSTR